jgi:SOS response regulatory protein OraA/RecX
LTKSCYQKAVELLSFRPHFVVQLRQKLSDRHYSDDEIEASVERLTRSGLLDDFETARGFVASRLRRGPIGRRRMEMELARRGAGEAVVEAMLEESFSGSDLEAVRQAAERWAAGGKRNLQALARHLDRKGFAAGSIWTVLDEVKAGWADEGD